MQTVMSMTPRKNKIRIVTHVGVVEAPLPDNVGYSVGSEYSAPFEGNVLSGTLGKVAIASGNSPKVGISTTKFYSSPEPSEISLELEFNAFYSAREEVLIPVARLMVAALGIEVSYQEALEELQDMVDTIRGQIGSNIGTESGETAQPDSSNPNTAQLQQEAEDFAELIGFIKAPPRTSTIYIGNISTLEDVYISSVAPQFSNVVDADGYPLKATVSMTAVFRKSPLAGDVARSFGLGKVGQGALSSGFGEE